MRGGLGLDPQDVPNAFDRINGTPFSTREGPSFAQEINITLIAKRSAFVGGEAWAGREVIEGVFAVFLVGHVIVVFGRTSEASGPTREATGPTEGQTSGGAGRTIAGRESKGLFS